MEARMKWWWGNAQDIASITPRQIRIWPCNSSLLRCQRCRRMEKGGWRPPRSPRTLDRKELVAFSSCLSTTEPSRESSRPSKQLSISHPNLLLFGLLLAALAALVVQAKALLTTTCKLNGRSNQSNLCTVHSYWIRHQRTFIILYRVNSWCLSGLPYQTLSLAVTISECKNIWSWLPNIAALQSDFLETMSMRPAHKMHVREVK